MTKLTAKNVKFSRNVGTTSLGYQGEYAGLAFSEVNPTRSGPGLGYRCATLWNNDEPYIIGSNSHDSPATLYLAPYSGDWSDAPTFNVLGNIQKNASGQRDIAFFADGSGFISSTWSNEGFTKYSLNTNTTPTTSMFNLPPTGFISLTRTGGINGTWGLSVDTVNDRLYFTNSGGGSGRIFWVNNWSAASYNSTSSLTASHIDVPGMPQIYHAVYDNWADVLYCTGGTMIYTVDPNTWTIIDSWAAGNTANYILVTETEMILSQSNVPSTPGTGTSKVYYR